MKNIIHLLLASLLAVCAVRADEKWITLFEGTGLDGWDRLGNANWTLAGGAVQATEGKGFLVTKEPYAEDARPDPISWYGETKRQCEEQVLAAGDRHAIVRVAWVFGPDRDSFVDKALQTALRGEPVKAVADKWSSPSYTLDIAEALRVLWRSDNAPGGIYHVCNRGVCTWRDWAEEGINAAAALGLPVKTREVEPLKLADITAMVAQRPVYTPMTCTRIEGLLGRPLRSWQEAVADYVRLLSEEGRLHID
jgi:dTDP-4-dehydrorhamnose reductase